MGHIHQHLLSARLDVEIDGPNNTVVECDTIALPAGPENPYGNAFLVEETVLADRDSRHARRRFRPDALLEGHQPGQAKNWLGGPTEGYKLEARSPVKPFTHPNSPFGPPLPDSSSTSCG